MLKQIDSMHNFCKCGQIKYKYAKECWGCYKINCKGKNCCHYKHGKCLQIYYCRDCGIKTSGFRAKRCQSCSAKHRLKKKSNHPNWKGGKQKRLRPRNTKQYLDWRNKIFKQDDFTCQLCGQYGGKLQVHHLKSWEKYPKERYDLKNGITLCIKCHKNYHKKYGIITNDITLKRD